MVGICPRSPRDVGLEQNKPFCHAGKPRAGDATQGRFSDLNRPPSSSVAVVQLLLVTIWRKPSMPLCMIESYLRQIRNAARLGGHELVQPFESRVHPVRPCSEETNQPMVGAAKAADGCLAAHAALCSQ